MALLGYIVIMFIASSTGCAQQEVLGTKDVEPAMTSSTPFSDTVPAQSDADQVGVGPSFASPRTFL